MDDQLTGYQRHLPCPPGVLEKLQRLLGVELPGDYRAFLEAGDGGEGFVGEDYLVLWRAGSFIHSTKTMKFKPTHPDCWVLVQTGEVRCLPSICECRRTRCLWCRS